MQPPMNIAIGCAAVAFVVLWPLWQVVALAARQWKYMKHLPGPPPTHWLLGHVPDILSTGAPMQLAAYAKQYGGVYRIRFLYQFGAIVTDPSLVRGILQSSKTYVPKSRKLMRALEVASGAQAVPNIITSSDGLYWRLVRVAWMKCFTSTHLKRLLPILQDLCERVTQQIEQQATTAATTATAEEEHTEKHEGAEDLATAPAAPAGNAGPVPGAAAAGSALVNICNITDRITLDMIGHVSYGRDFGAVDHQRSRYLELVSAMLQVMHEEMDHPLRRLINRLGARHKQKALVRAEWDATNTAEVVRALADPPGEHTIAGQLMAVVDPATNQPLALHQLKSELVIATLAGFETTSNALSWTLAALAAHPQAMQALEQELDAAGLLATPQNPHPGRFEWQTLGKLSYLQSCIREGLRLFSPAAQGSFRLCTTHDIQLTHDFMLPKNTVVGIPLFAFGHNPATYGPDVEDFKPERWLAAQGSRGNPPGVVTSSMNSMNSMSSVDESSDGKAAAGTGSMDSSSSLSAGTGPQQQQQQPRASSSGKQLQDPWSFSIGPRDCAGQALARLELQVVIAKIVGSFKVQLAPEVGDWQGVLARRMFHTTLQARGGMPMVLTPRVVRAARGAAGGAGV